MPARGTAPFAEVAGPSDRTDPAGERGGSDEFGSKSAIRTDLRFASVVAPGGCSESRERGAAYGTSDAVEAEAGLIHFGVAFAPYRLEVSSVSARSTTARIFSLLSTGCIAGSSIEPSVGLFGLLTHPSTPYLIFSFTTRFSVSRRCDGALPFPCTSSSSPSKTPPSPLVVPAS